MARIMKGGAADRSGQFNLLFCVLFGCMWDCSVDTRMKNIYITTGLHSVLNKAGMSLHLNLPVLCHKLSISIM